MRKCLKYGVSHPHLSRSFAAAWRISMSPQEEKEFIEQAFQKLKDEGGFPGKNLSHLPLRSRK